MSDTAPIWEILFTWAMFGAVFGGAIAAAWWARRRRRRGEESSSYNAEGAEAITMSPQGRPGSSL